MFLKVVYNNTVTICGNAHFTEKKNRNKAWQLRSENRGKFYFSNFYISILLEFFTYVNHFCNQEKKHLQINHSGSFLAMTQFTRRHLSLVFHEPTYKTNFMHIYIT